MTENPLAQPYRPIRRVMPPDAPLPAILAACADQTVLLVEAEAVPEVLWRPDEPVHVWAPVDVARRGQAQAAVFTWCTSTLEAYLRRRGSEPVAGGEAVTLLVSLIRGFREAAVDDAATGRWWLTDAGCPTFVPGDGARLKLATLDAADEIAAQLGDRAVSRLVAELQQVLGPPASNDGLDRIERALFDAYAPKPLRAFAPRSDPARALPDGAGSRADRAAAPRSAGERRRARPPRESLMQRVRILLSELVRRPDAAPPQAAIDRSGAPRARRRGILLAAAGAACVVLVVGLAWPNGAPERAAGAQGIASGASPAADPTGAPAVTAAESQDRASEDPVVAARWLIAAARSCGDCADLALSTAAANDAAQLADPTLLEDYGGVAVVRAASAAGERFLVMERRDGQWWIRGVSARDG